MIEWLPYSFFIDSDVLLLLVQVVLSFTVGYLLLSNKPIPLTTGLMAGAFIMLAASWLALAMVIATLDTRWYTLQVVSLLAAISLLVAFGYRFPRPVPQEKREARRVLTLSLTINILLLLWRQLFPQVRKTPVYIYPLTLVLFLHLLWGMVVLIRHTRYFHQRALASPPPTSLRERARLTWQAFLRPASREAQAARVFVLVSIVLLLMTAVGNWLENFFPTSQDFMFTANMTGLFSFLLTVFQFVFVFAYLNYTPEWSSFVTKLRLVIFVATLTAIGTLGRVLLFVESANFHEMHLQAIGEVRELLVAGEPLTAATLPEEVALVASPPQQSTATYTLHFAQPPYATALVPQPDWHCERAVCQLGDDPLKRYYLPSHPPLLYEGRSYLVGLSYATYRDVLTTRAVPFLIVLFGYTALILLVSPHLFRRNLMQPLARLLEGVAAVNAGDFDVVLPVYYSDEIGRITETFNFMTATIREERDQLEAQIEERTTEVMRTNTRLMAEITQRHYAEQVLRESETLYRTVVERANDGIIIVQEGKILYSNEQMAAIMGYTVPELKEKSLEEILAEDQRARTMQIYQRRVNGKPVPARYESAVTHRDGQRIEVEVHAAPITYHGAPASLAVVRDVTERRQAEETLRKLSRAVEQSGSAIVITDKEGAIEFVNPAFSRISGYSQQEAMGKNPRLLKSGKMRPEIYTVLWDTITRGDVWQGELLNKKKNGELFWESVIISPVTGDEGEIAHYVAVKEDITQRKEAQAALQRRVEELTALNTITQAVATYTNVQEILETVAEKIVLLFDAHSAVIALLNEERTAQSLGAIYATDARVAGNLDLHIPLEEDAAGRHVLETGEALLISDMKTLPLTQYNRELVKKYGVQSLMMFPLWARGETIGTLTVITDQAGRAFTQEEAQLAETIAGQLASAIAAARLFEETRAAREAAEAANRAKSTFLANMSHELRTPLNAILGFSELMFNSPSLTPAQQRNLETINRSGEHLLGLINDVLELSKIEAGYVKVQPENFDLHQLLLGIEEMFRMRAEQKGLQLVSEQDPLLPQYVRTDQGKLRQVLINLLGNAIKFTQQGHVTLRVTYESPDDCLEESPAMDLHREECLHFEITDTGVGIAPQEFEKLFEPFLQTASGEHAQTGTGLGLPISRQYVHLLGGELTAASALDVGSTFSFDIPVEVVQVTEAQAPTPSRRVTGLAAGQPQYRILVAEDDEDSRLILTKTLEPLGFAVRAVANGKAAVESWEQWQPHMILLDLRMPVMDGYQVIREIHARVMNPEREGITHPIIVAVTALAFEEERARVLNLGCEGFISKPFRKEQLLNVLRTHLRVEFAYEAPAPPPPGQPQPEKKAQELPPAWSQQLREATTKADIAQIYELIAEIADDYPEESARLQEWADDFAYEKIVAFLDDRATATPPTASR